MRGGGWVRRAGTSRWRFRDGGTENAGGHGWQRATGQAYRARSSAIASFDAFSASLRCLSASFASSFCCARASACAFCAAFCRDLWVVKRRSVEVRRGDFVIFNTGQMADCLDRGDWGGYAGGDAPGMAFETLDWIYNKEIAGYASDTWGNEVRPCETDENINQPWHWIAIPILGLTMGEIFYLKDIADDCAEDKVYEFMFVAPALPITGAVGSPVNPLAIK